MLKRVQRHHIFAVGIAILVWAPAIASAVGLPTKIVPCDGTSCTCKDLETLANNILYAIIYLSVFMSAILFAWAGWWFMTGRSGGNSEYISYAKEVSWNVMIGLVIILAAWLVVDTIMRGLTGMAIWSSLCN